jgi:hypothetical protein
VPILCGILPGDIWGYRKNTGLTVGEPNSSLGRTTPRNSVRELCVFGGRPGRHERNAFSNLEECFQYSQRLLQLIGVQPQKQALDFGHQDLTVNFLGFVFEKS